MFVIGQENDLLVLASASVGNRAARQSRDRRRGPRDHVYNKKAAGFAIGSSIGVWLYEAFTSRTLSLLPTLRRVHAFGVGSPDGTLASGNDGGGVELWDMENAYGVRRAEECGLSA